MSYSIPVIPRATTATAFQLVEGETSASQIWAISPDIQVGHRDGDERDLRWVIVTTPEGPRDAHYGDWIVSDPLGHITIHSPESFAALWSPAGDDARATLRSRDVSDPRVQEAQRIAKGFSDTLRSA